MMKILRNFLENKKIDAFNAEIKRLEVVISSFKLEMYDYMDRALKPLIRRDAVRRTREKNAKKLETNETEKDISPDGLDEIRNMNR